MAKMLYNATDSKIKQKAHKRLKIKRWGFRLFLSLSLLFNAILWYNQH